MTRVAVCQTGERHPISRLLALENGDVSPIAFERAAVA
jgi:hypothetical protein